MKINFSDRKIPTPRSSLLSLHRAIFLSMASTLSHESKQPEGTYQDAIDEVERAQVAKGWTRAMMRYGVEARG